MRNFRMLFLIILVSSLYAQNITIYINNVLNTSNPDGSQNSPYTSFEEALNKNISLNINSKKPIVKFQSTGKPYLMGMSWPITGNSIGDNDLTLTSDYPNFLNQSLDCSQIPAIIISEDLFIMNTNTLKFQVSNLNILLSPRNTTLFGFKLSAQEQLNLEMSNICASWEEPLDKISLGLVSSRSSNASTAKFQNIYINGIFWNEEFGKIIDLNLPDKSQVSIDSMEVNVAVSAKQILPREGLFSFNTNNLLYIAESITIHKVTIKGSISIEEPSDEIPSLFYLENFANAVVQDFSFRDLELSSLSLYGLRVMNGLSLSLKNIDALGIYSKNNNPADFFRLIMIESPIKELALSMDSVSVIGSTNTGILEVNSFISELNITQLLVQNSDLTNDEYLISLRAYEKNPSPQTIKNLYITDFQVINSTLFGRVLEVSGLTPPPNEIINNPTIPPYQLNMYNVKLLNNIITYPTKSAKPDTNVFLVSNVAYLLQNSIFQGNKWENVSVFGNSYYAANMYLIENKFIGEDFKTATFIITNQTTIFDDQKNVTQLYRLLLIQNCIFRDITYYYKGNTALSIASFIHNMAPFLLIRGNIFYNLQMTLGDRKSVV